MIDTLGNVHRPFRGYTLMELLLVIAILAITSAVAIPTVWKNLGREVDVRSLQAIAIDLEYARSMGLSDVSTYAGVKTGVGSTTLGFASQTRRLESDSVFDSAVNFQFDGLGRPTGGAQDLYLKSVASGNRFGKVSVSVDGLITWSTGS